jgi:hypothetical protein
MLRHLRDHKTVRFPPSDPRIGIETINFQILCAYDMDFELKREKLEDAYLYVGAFLAIICTPDSSRPNSRGQISVHFSPTEK